MFCLPATIYKTFKKTKSILPEFICQNKGILLEYVFMPFQLIPGNQISRLLFSDYKIKFPAAISRNQCEDIHTIQGRMQFCKVNFFINNSIDYLDV